MYTAPLLMGSQTAALQNVINNFLIINVLFQPPATHPLIPVWTCPCRHILLSEKCALQIAGGFLLPQNSNMATMHLNTPHCKTLTPIDTQMGSSTIAAYTTWTLVMKELAMTVALHTAFRWLKDWKLHNAYFTDLKVKWKICLAPDTHSQLAPEIKTPWYRKDLIWLCSQLWLDAGCLQCERKLKGQTSS